MRDHQLGSNRGATEEFMGELDVVTLGSFPAPRGLSADM